ncbi:glycosyltransferase [Polynucleobacter sp. MWH-UH23A]|uniref:glycosyltransferase n=1 Tax=Polynucleobacter sp. MWH-UH23A TaxID=1855613 RepID=UPI0033650603
MKNILVISKQAEEYVNREVYHILASWGYLVKVCVPVQQKFLTDVVICNDSSISVERVKVFGGHPRLQFIPNLLETLNEKNYDFVIIDNDIASIVVTQVGLIKSRKTKLIVCTFENFYRNYINEALKALLNLKISIAIALLGIALIERFNSFLVNLIFVFSSESKDVNHRKFRKIDIQQIPLGISSILFHESSYDQQQNFRLKYNASNKVIVAYFGRLIREKGLDDLYELIKNHPRKDDFVLMIDDYFESNNGYVKHIKKNFTELLGENFKLIRANHNEIAYYIRNVDIIVCPSHQNSKYKEQYGRVIVEAKLSKTRVVCSDSGAFPETHGDVNFIFKAGNMPDFRRAFDYAVNASQTAIDRLHIDALNRQTSGVQAHLLASLL